MDLAQMMTQFATTALAFWRLLWSLAALVGLLYSGSVLMRVVRASKTPGMVASVSKVELLAVLVIGACLVNLPQLMNATWSSFGNTQFNYGAIAYPGAATFGRLADAINAVLTVAAVAGGFFFLKGVLLLKQASVEGRSSHNGEDSVWRAMTHMFGGVGLVRIVDMIDAFRVSFGLNW